MRPLLIVLALSLLAGCGKSNPLSRHIEKDTGPIKIVVTGQSNADSGDGELVASETGQVTLEYGLKSRFTPTDADPADQMVAWVHLGDLLYAQTGRPVQFYGRSAGGTSSIKWAGNHFGLLDQAVNTIRDVKPQYVIWVQGESDYIERIHHSDTYELQRQIYTAFKNAYPQTTILIAITGGWQGNEDDDVCVAQYEHIASGLVRKGANIQAMRREEIWALSAWGYHLNLAGKQRLAREYFEAIRQIL